MINHANVMPGPAAAARTADPRVLLLAVLSVVVASTATVRTPVAMLVLFGFVVCGHVAAAGRARTLRMLLRILPFAAMIIVLNGVLVPGDALLAVAGWRVLSSQGLHDGVFFALRLGVMLTAVSLLLAGTSPEGLARGVHGLLHRLSARLADRIAFFMFLSMGFVPLLVDEMERVRIAQSFRGGELKGGMLRRAGSVRSWLVPVLMSAIHRSDQLALAVELRETRARLIPAIPAPRLRTSDAVVLLVTAGLVVLVSRHP